ASQRTFPEIGVPETWHPLSHHGDNPEKLEQQAKLNTYFLRMFGVLLEKLMAVPDGEGSLLDHTLLLYGSGMSNSNLPVVLDVPTLVVGGSAFRIGGGRHVRYPKGTPLTNLQLTLLERLGLSVENFGDSNGQLQLLSQV